MRSSQFCSLSLLLLLLSVFLLSSTIVVQGTPPQLKTHWLQENRSLLRLLDRLALHDKLTDIHYDDQEYIFVCETAGQQPQRLGQVFVSLSSTDPYFQVGTLMVDRREAAQAFGLVDKTNDEIDAGTGIPARLLTDLKASLTKLSVQSNLDPKPKGMYAWSGNPHPLLQLMEQFPGAKNSEREGWTKRSVPYYVAVDFDGGQVGGA